MTLRLDDETASALAAVALVNGTSKSDVVRHALRQHLERCAEGESFRARWDVIEGMTFSADMSVDRYTP